MQANLCKNKTEHQQFLFNICSALVKHTEFLRPTANRTIYKSESGSVYDSEPQFVEKLTVMKLPASSEDESSDSTFLLVIPKYSNQCSEAETSKIDSFDMGSLYLLDILRPLKGKNIQKVQDILYFKYIPDMLDLNDKTICELLPYLLTSYLCTSANNDFFINGTAGPEEVFELRDKKLDHSRLTRRKDEIERLSRKFSLKGHKIEPPSHKSGPKSEHGPNPYFVNRENPFNDKLFVEYIFASFAVITKDSNQIRANSKLPPKNIARVRHKIDLMICYFLFLLHINPDRLNEILSAKTDGDVKTRLEYFRKIFSKEYLLGNFYPYYDNYRF